MPQLFGPLLPVVAGLALCRAIGTLAWSEVDGLLMLVAVSFATHGTVLAGWPLWAKLVSLWPALGQARLANWLVFWAISFASAALGSCLYTALWPQVAGTAAPLSLWTFEPAITVLGAIFLVEQDAAEARDASRKEAAAWALVSDLVASREAIRALDARDADVLHTHLRDRIGRAIEDLRVDLGAAGGPGMRGSDLSRIKQCIDHLREEEVRAASHLVHPRLARRGLIPAIRAHVRHWETQIATAISVDSGAEAADASGTGTLTPERRMAAYCFYDAAITRAWSVAGATSAAVALRGRSSDTLRLEISHPAPAVPDHSIALHLAGVRVASVGGHWQEVREGGSVKVSLELPLAALPDPVEVEPESAPGELEPAEP